MPENEKLVVAPFNKKEIEQISVEATKKAIGEGDIAVGTKLYKHLIHIDDTNGEDNLDRYIYVISTILTPVTNEDSCLDVLWNATSPMFLCDGVASEFAFFDPENGCVSVVDIGGSVKGNLDLTTSSFTDYSIKEL